MAGHTDEAILEAFLSMPGHPDGTLSLGMLRGFMFAVAAAPDIVKPSEWLPVVFGGEEPEFETAEEAQEVVGALMRLYNAMNALVRGTGPRTPEGCEFRDDILANFEPDAPVSQWSEGFRVGHLWLKDVWDGYLPEDHDLLHEFGSTLIVLTYFASRTVAESLVAELGSSGATLTGLSTKCRNLFPEAVAGYAEMGTAIWQDVAESREDRGPGPAPSGVTVGRNDPCPCGSGRKYKKCCGAYVS